MQEKGFFSRNKGWIIALGIVVLVGFWWMGSYNSFVTQNEQITGQWAQVENQYQRRFDLIPNIVETVKGVAKQEQEVFGAIADARTRYAGAASADEKAAAASQVESALGRLLVIAENYPVLQSSQAYRDLITTLEGTENRISVERMKYNDIVRSYNTNVKRFPTSLIARLSGFGEHAYFDIAEGVDQVPKVNF
jgi:LemA protein